MCALTDYHNKDIKDKPLSDAHRSSLMYRNFEASSTKSNLHMFYTFDISLNMRRTAHLITAKLNFYRLTYSWQR